jgi:hypothetical protein
MQLRDSPTKNRDVLREAPRTSIYYIVIPYVLEVDAILIARHHLQFQTW